MRRHILPKISTNPSFPKKGILVASLRAESLRHPFVKGGKEEFNLLCLHNYRLTSKSRFEDVLKYFDFRSKGFEVIINRTYFLTNGTDTLDLIKRALEV